MVFVLIYLSLAGFDPVVLQQYAVAADCDAALTTIRTLDNEVKPFKHFCVTQDALAAYVAQKEKEDVAIMKRDRDD